MINWWAFRDGVVTETTHGMSQFFLQRILAESSAKNWVVFLKGVSGVVITQSYDKIASKLSRNRRLKGKANKIKIQLRLTGRPSYLQFKGLLACRGLLWPMILCVSCGYRRYIFSLDLLGLITQERNDEYIVHALCQFLIFSLKNGLKSSMFRVTRISPFTLAIAAICPSTNDGVAPFDDNLARSLACHSAAMSS